MRTAAFILADLAELHRLANAQTLESCAAAFVHRAGEPGEASRYVVRELMHAPDDAYLTRTEVRASLRPEFMMTIANRARSLQAGIVLLHTHPGPDALEGFSGLDDQGETALAAYFNARIPGHDHFAAVVTQSRVHMRGLGCGSRVRALAVGPAVRDYAGGQDYAEDARYDRQVRAFGSQGQAILHNTALAIVGLGGTGSIVAHQLAHLGVGNLLLIDHDTVDESNLNRLLGATPGDIGKPKVNVAAAAVQAINPRLGCEAVVGDVVDAAVAAKLLGVDFIFACTDSMASRAVVNQMAYQYLIPTIDMGVAIRLVQGRISSVTGRVHMLSAGLGCLVCADGIDGQQVRWEMMTHAQRRADPYFEGASVPQPAVMPLNGIVTSAAVTMFLSAMTAYPSDARLLHYDGIRGSVRPQLLKPVEGCIVCSPEGALARSSTWTLPVRHEPGRA
jgi:molybdopterin-synthase adenylyltransferase